MEIENICRTCLGLSGPLLSIYDSNSDGCIAIMLSSFSKIKPTRGDNLPDKVCLNCLSEINHCYTFILKCENSNRTLRQLLPDAAPEEIERFKSNNSHAEMCNKSIQTTSETHIKLTSTEVQTTESMVNQQVLVEQEIQRTTDYITNIMHINNSDDDNNKEDDSLIETETTNENNELDDSELIFKRFQADDGQNNNEIVLEFLNKRDRANNKNPDSSEIKKKKRPSINYDEDAAYIEIDDSSHDYNISAVNVNKDDMPVVHNNKQKLKNQLNLTRSIKHQIDEEDDISLGNDFTQNQNYNFTIYEVYGETTVIPRRPITRSSYNPTSSTKPTFKCSDCSLSFSSGKLLERHVFKKHIWSHDIGKYTTATKTTKSQNVPINKNLTIKTKIDDNEKESTTLKSVTLTNSETMVKLKYFCELCNAGFALSKSLNYHRQLKSCTIKSFKCEECDRVFITNEHLKEHRFTHVLANTCTDCHKVFTTTDELSQHMVDVHKRSLRHQCNVCKKVFTMTSALRDHLRTHSGEKPFLCTVCGKGFSQNANLKQHSMRHTKEKNFKCNQCAFSFVTKAELASHLRRHTGDTPYKCEYCDGAFTTSSSLLKHRRKHTGERPYACDICPMRFAALNVLKNHRRTHTGEKPYKCIYCSKAFTQKGDCHIHQRSHTEKSSAGKYKNSYSCLCGKNFSHLNQWRTHNCEHSHKGQQSILNSAVTSYAKTNHLTSIDSDISIAAASVIEEELAHGQTGEEELMQIAIDMC